MALNWKKWGFTFWQSLAKHIGTAGMTWAGLSSQDGKLDVNDIHSLWIALLAGAVFPTLFTFLQTNPTPEVIEESVTVTTTTVKPPTPEPPTNT